MGSRKMLMTTAMVALLALPLAACSSHRQDQILQAVHRRGRHVLGQHVATRARRDQKTAMQMCQAHGGVYDSVLDMCEMPGDK